MIRLKDNTQSVQKISEIPIKVVNNSEIIQLQDIANISKKPLSPVEDIFLYNGKVVVSVAALGSMSQRVHDYVDRARLIVDDMRSSLPEEITI